jgi:hypothetical protein
MGAVSCKTSLIQWECVNGFLQVKESADRLMQAVLQLCVIQKNVFYVGDAYEFVLKFRVFIISVSSIVDLERL